MLKAVCFDMFHTLADPSKHPETLDSAFLNIPHEQWSAAMWEKNLCRERGLGTLKTLREIIDRACDALPVLVSAEKREELTAFRAERFRLMMREIDPEIVDTVRALKEMGLKIGLISNADVGDRIYWPESPLYPYFDDTIFSCDVGLVKPDPAIYRLSLEHLHVRPPEALFVGDGGDRELMGAKETGMHTVCTEFLIRRPDKERSEIHAYADRVIGCFRELVPIAQAMRA